MSRVRLLLTALLSIFVASASATVVEIPLSGLLGPYPVSESVDSRTVTFQLPGPPSVIHGISFRISGVQTLGWITCEWGGPYEWPMQFFPEMYEAPSDYWMAGVYPPLASGPFTSTAPFTAAFPGSTWAFLLDGTGEIILHGSPAGLVGLCFMNPVPPVGEITEAVLIVDAEFPNPVETSTWGKIKALYRD
jgi:hypothetical protein